MDGLPKPQGMNDRRHFLLLLTFTCFISRWFDPEAAASLRLLWRSLPDAYLTYQEMQETFQMQLQASELENFFNFYQEVIQENSPVMKPRSLLDLCRGTIRKELDTNKLYLPNAIEELKVPRRMKRFLNLSDLYESFCLSVNESDDESQSEADDDLNVKVFV
ncbi:hypothetical protein CDAR_87431 [Caerostris darwini]|uniref:SOCS box domain-containing protein n=1 Tax=Caerostris darwini TaxID=1538125 RepID=A0AAV4R622_9ARAC|nr:hypothetical protein CDAR_87431 [Caerostris darwini]